LASFIGELNQQLLKLACFLTDLLWPPYVIGQAIIFLPCGFFFYLSIFMAALRSRCGHYILVLFLSTSFFPCLIAAVADWMSAILPHMVWP